MEKLTDQKYWENYYSKTGTTRNKIESICSYYDNFWEILIGKNDNNGDKTLIEIGGHPGRYLAYLADKYHLETTSLDFNSDRSKIEESMAAFGIKNYHIIQADFFKYKPKEQFDIVISNGFVEHFENFEEVMEMHLQYLKPGGTLLIMIPNMKGYIKWYKTFLDKQNLSIHNLKSMKIKVFKDFARNHKLRILHLSYFGYFPFNVHQTLNYFQLVFFHIHRFLFKKFINKFLKTNPNRFLSSTLVGIYKK